MATTFGWKKKTPHDLSRKRPAAFLESEGNDKDAPDELREENSRLLSKRLQSTTGLEERESAIKRLTDEGIALAEKERCIGCLYIDLILRSVFGEINV
jgi:hypothetical protein